MQAAAGVAPRGRSVSAFDNARWAMPADPNLSSALQQYLRRTYASNLNGLRVLAEQTFAQATEAVTITQQSFEGGASTGTITCPRAVLLQAIEDVLLELDDTAPRPSRSAVCYFR